MRAAQRALPQALRDVDLAVAVLADVGDAGLEVTTGAAVASASVVAAVLTSASVANRNHRVNINGITSWHYNVCQVR